jgi:hypothetical protein
MGPRDFRVDPLCMCTRRAENLRCRQRKSRRRSSPPSRESPTAGPLRADGPGSESSRIGGRARLGLPQLDARARAPPARPPARRTARPPEPARPSPAVAPGTAPGIKPGTFGGGERPLRTALPTHTLKECGGCVRRRQRAQPCGSCCFASLVRQAANSRGTGVMSTVRACALSVRTDLVSPSAACCAGAVPSARQRCVRFESLSHEIDYFSSRTTHKRTAPFFRDEPVVRILEPRDGALVFFRARHVWRWLSFHPAPFLQGRMCTSHT